MQRVQAPPPPLTTTLRTTEGRWVEHGPGDHRKLLRYEEGTGMASFLIRLEPGTVVQTHGHLFDEECLVLEGEVVIGEHTFREGDWHVAHKGAVHHQFGTRTGCLLFIRAEASEGPAGWLQSAR